MTAVRQPLLGALIDSHLAAIVVYSTDAIIGLALDNTITSWNPAAERLYQYTAAEVLGQPLALIVPPDRRPEFDALMARTVSGELIQGFETVRLRKDRSMVEVSISKSTIHDPAGGVIGIASITRDISATKEAERERLRFALEHAARAEAETAAWRASVLAGVSRVLVENFMDHRPMLERVARMAAIATDTACVIELLPEDGGETMEPLAIDHADQDVCKELSRVLSAPHHVDDSPWRDLGRVFLENHPLRDTLSVPILARTATIGVLSLGRFGADAPSLTDHDREFTDDLATRVGLAVENARLYEHARCAIELRDTFLTVAAHELKTPLTTIQGYAQLLSLQLDQGLGMDANPVRRAARMIEDRTRHLARLVEQILDVSRLDASRLKLDVVDLDLAALTRNLVAGFARRHPREFRLHVAGPVQAAVDPVRIEQVLANLIDNAVRYSPDGGAIDISVEPQPDQWVVLSVRDRGLGIAEEQRAHVFDRFHQAHGVSYRSGMGLGLHISREIVALHGGEINATFPADGGSQFTVRLLRSDSLHGADTVDEEPG
ncbi:MAG TPA: ATP-binding protein [Chloroflexota bacterium]|nr:ATP-binding protein [Chloroflexota bacterium]